MIVLPMAGLSSRFFKAGYELPKYMLDLHGHSIFAHVLSSFAKQISTEQFLIICRDVFDTPRFIRAQCDLFGLGPEQLEIVVLGGETAGQAETVAEGVRQGLTQKDDPLTIFNIDTFRPGFQAPTIFDPIKVDGYLEVFEGPGEHWSFARTRPGTDRVLEVTEKVRISDLCSTGLYHFRTTALFQSLYKEIEMKDPATLQGGEYYIAPLYNIAIKRGLDIRCNLIESEEVSFCGTPQEYNELQARMPFIPTMAVE